MSAYSVVDWVGKRKNIIFVGESGSGKSELSVHLALELAEQKAEKVHLFDMDQTRPLFRSRALRRVLEGAGVECHAAPQVLDTPTMADGVRHCLLDEGCYTILDVGGNAGGARLIGGLSSCFSGEDTVVGYLVNPYRPWDEEICATGEAVLRAAHIRTAQVIAGPSLGRTTSAEEFMEGLGRLARMEGVFEETAFAVVMDTLYEEVKERSPLPLVPIHLYMRYPWEEE